MLKIGIDLDNCISYRPDFFQLMTHSMKDVAEIHIITNREESPRSEESIRVQLEDLNIFYHHLKITGEKAQYIMENNITIYYDDTDSYFLGLPEEVTVFKIREPWNFDFNGHKWVYTDKNGKKVDRIG